MADYIPVRAVLEGWVTALTTLPTQWVDYPKDLPYNERGWCDLSISGDLTVGRDEVNDEYDATAAPEVSVRTFQETASTFVFGVKIQTYIAKANADAEYYAKEIREQISLPKISAEVLRGGGLAVATILADVPVGVGVATQDGRPISIHQFDIMMNTTSRREDTPGTWIETVADVDLEVPAGNVVATFDIDV
jgi:hypothetical protein